MAHSTITDQQKTAISQAANKYLQARDMMADDLVKKTGINTSYMNYMLNGKFMAGTTIIADKYWGLLADAVDFKIGKSYWPHVNTREFEEVLPIVQRAKEKCQVSTIILNSGWGKTYTAAKLERAMPKHTYVVKLHSMMLINDLFDALARQLGISTTGSRGVKQSMIVMTLRDIMREGGKPLIILDEAENMDRAMRGVIKGFYDVLDQYCGIVLMGTPTLKQILEKARDINEQCGPQLWRRLKPGMVEVKINLSKEDKFKPFFDALAIKEQPFRNLLTDICDNYGELNLYLEPALREAADMGEKMDEDFFRALHNMPRKLKRA